jgi:hypothetical protein
MKLNRSSHPPIAFPAISFLYFLCYAENIASGYKDLKLSQPSPSGSISSDDGGRDSLQNVYELHAYVADCSRSLNCIASGSYSYVIFI